MMGRESRHTKAFRATKLKPKERILGVLSGWIGEMMGSSDKTQHNGEFVVTNTRACFYRKGIFGEVFQTIPLAKITSVETLSRLGYRMLCLHTSHDELKFKTFEAKEIFEQVYNLLEDARGPDTLTVPAVGAATRDERECPYCAESILRKAIVCKHCGRDIVD